VKLDIPTGQVIIKACHLGPVQQQPEPVDPAAWLSVIGDVRLIGRLTETAVVPESRPLKGFVHDGIWFSLPLIESLQAE